MSQTPRTTRTRWIVALAAAVALVGGTIAVTTNAVATTPLPPLSAQELLTKVAAVEVDGMSGTVEQTSNLGLPQLPSGMGGQDLGSALALLTGTHTFRVWTSGTDKARVALVDGPTETAVIANGTSIWMWSSADQKATHRVVDADEHDASTPMPAGTPATPAEMVKQLLEKASPTTEFTTSGTATVAGRSVYELVATPKDDAALVRDVRVSIDSETFVPLAVTVTGTADEPAISVAFTSVDFSVPDASIFTFTPPPGAKVTEATPGAELPDSPTTPASEKPVIVGESWTTVVVATMPSKGVDVPDAEADETEGSVTDQLAPLLSRLPRVSGDWGAGRLFSTTLINVVITDDGRVAAGSVEPQLLYQALAGR
ncbi:MAG TPA: hypothetical protein VLR88_06015 [Propionibacteriaceae bacterium]|nr:hypothetical protein [Propionibacteriaceae bacterium]